VCRRSAGRRAAHLKPTSHQFCTPHTRPGSCEAHKNRAKSPGPQPPTCHTRCDAGTASVLQLRWSRPAAARRAPPRSPRVEAPPHPPANMVTNTGTGGLRTSRHTSPPAVHHVLPRQEGHLPEPRGGSARSQCWRSAGRRCQRCLSCSPPPRVGAHPIHDRALRRVSRPETAAAPQPTIMQTTRCAGAPLGGGRPKASFAPTPPSEVQEGHLPEPVAVLCAERDGRAVRSCSGSAGVPLEGDEAPRPVKVAEAPLDGAAEGAFEPSPPNPRQRDQSRP
jgi:hypothetical protein